MDTNKLKRFATEARNKIRRGVLNKLLSLGFNEKGEAAEFPVQLQGATLYRGEQLEMDFYPRWIALHEAITRQGVKEICEEVAYTWFNRFMAIRILSKNKFIDRALLFDDPTIRVPHIVSEARQGRVPQMSTDERLRLRTIIADPNKTFDQFALLITALCHATPILNQCFGSINDYTELLLPTDILDEGGFIDMVNHTEFIKEEDYKTTELLGWLYQFYIAERKDEVFASFKKGGKAEADDIPAATQIFTPNWIVKYMVENTVGRIYLDNNPDSNLAKKMPYLVERAEGNREDIYTYNQLEELKVLEPACGSGHILLEAFDLLYQLYLDEFYSRDKAITAIFRHNLFGIDIDNRARQLATFALLLKACQRDESFLDGHCMPRVLCMPQVDRYTFKDLNGHFDCAYQLENPGQETFDELVEAFTLMEQADNLGSIMKFNISAKTRNYVSKAVEAYEAEPKDPKNFGLLISGYRMLLALTDKYAAVVANPPYMGAGNMNKELSDYVKKNYPDSKSDLFSVFMDVSADHLAKNGKYGMINMQSWMFLSSFEKLRRKVLDNNQIDSMLHLGPRTFDELSGEVVQNTAFVIANHTVTSGGTYLRLVDGKDCADKERMFKQAVSEHPDKLYYPNVKQQNFEKIPGCPIAFWINKNELSLYEKSILLDAYGSPKKGLDTGENDVFLRLWHEISWNKSSVSIGLLSKWYPYNKGGSKRKWYGNRDYLLNWENDGRDLKLRLDLPRKKPTLRNLQFQLSECFTWTTVSSKGFSTRYSPEGSFFDNGGCSIFSTDYLFYLGPLLNSKVAGRYFEFLSPTLNFQPGDIARVPYINEQTKDDLIKDVAMQNISISKQDWDAHETSWDFQENELLALSKGCGSENKSSESKNNAREQKIEDLLNKYHEKWERLFMQLHANEEELNRQFIDIYGLQDELSPDVPLNEVTILQQGEININEANQIVWHDDVVIKQLISYAVGCMMGRYSIDKPGLILANQGDGLEQYKQLVPNSRFEIDDDGIIPLMPEDSCFPDNATRRMSEFLKAAFVADSLIENLNCIEAKLGKRLEDYFAKDFWQDHKRMYQKRPIYWLFQSKKGAFKVLVYMHRMDPYTVGKVRNKYLLPYIEWLKGKIDSMMARQAELSKDERKKLQKYDKQLDECREYDIRLHEVANRQIAIDLDDGVVVNYAKYGDILAKIK